MGLGTLLVGASIITADCYRKAIHHSINSTIPLGKTLLAMRVITLPTLDSALYLANLIFNCEISLEKAAKALKRGVANNQSARELVREPRLFTTPPSEGPMLGGFLVEAGAIKDWEMVESLEIAMLNRTRIGQTLVQQGALSKELLEGAIKLQRMVVCGMLKLEDGLQCLRAAKAAAASSAETIKNAAKKICFLESAADLARSTGVLKRDLDPVTKLMQNVSGLPALEALFVAHDLPYELYKALVQSSKLVETGCIDERQAMQVVDVCERTRCTFNEAAEQLGLRIYDEKKEDLTRYECDMKVAKPRIFDAGSILQLFFNFGACAAATALSHYLLLPQFHMLSLIVVAFVFTAFAAATVLGAVKTCRKQEYEQEVNAQAAVLTKDKLRTLRTTGRNL
jgi:hypothetical protein